MQYITRFAFRYPRIWLVLKLLTVFPAVVFGYAAIKWTAKPLYGQDKLREIFEGNIPVTILCLVAPLALPHLFTFIDRGVVKMQDFHGSQKLIIAALVNALNELVGAKLKCIVNFASSIAGQVTKADVFDAITQPEDQICANLTYLHHLLHTTTKDDSLQLVLARISKNLPVEFTERVPKTYQLPPTLLTNDAKKTLFYHCASDNHPIVIPDIAKHLRKSKKKLKYHPAGNADRDTGSILAVPLFCEFTGNVEYVLTIKSDNANVINEEFRKSHKVPIDSFVTRLLLEHNILLIKKKAI